MLTASEAAAHGLVSRVYDDVEFAARVTDALRALPAGPEVVDDRDALAVVVEGRDRRGPVTVRVELTAGPQRRPPLSAVARNTGFPAAIVAGMLLVGRIRARGVQPDRPHGAIEKQQEEDVRGRLDGPAKYWVQDSPITREVLARADADFARIFGSRE